MKLKPRLEPGLGWTVGGRKKNKRNSPQHATVFDLESRESVVPVWLEHLNTLLGTFEYPLPHGKQSHSKLRQLMEKVERGLGYLGKTEQTGRWAQSDSFESPKHHAETLTKLKQDIIDDLLIDGVSQQTIDEWCAKAVKPNRRAFIEPLLKQKSLSERDWASEAGVDIHTVSDYMNDKTDPSPTTKGKLARALGLKSEDLP